jgi:hypothetical protein
MVFPTLAFNYSDSTGYAIALDGSLYYCSNFFTTNIVWNYVSLKESVRAVDTQNNASVVAVSEDGKSITGYWNNTPITIAKPSVFNISIISVTTYRGMMWVVGSDNGLYYNKDDYIVGTLKSVGYVRIATNVKKVLPITKQTNLLAFIGTNGKIYYDAQGYAKTILSLSEVNATDVVDAATDGYSIWWINSEGKIYFRASLTGTLVTLAPHWLSGGAIAIFANNSSGLGYIGKDGSVYFASGGSTISSTYPKWNKSGLTDLNENVSEPGDRIIFTAISTFKAKKYGTIHEYANLTNSLSNPGFGIYMNTNSNYSSTLSLISTLAKRGVTDFYPFKILSIYDLFMMGYVQLGSNEKNTVLANGTTVVLNYWIMTFNREQNYLPIGDVIVDSEIDIQTVYCALIVNNPKYCSIIKDEDFVNDMHSWHRNDDYWGYDRYTNYISYGSRVFWNIFTPTTNVNRNQFASSSNSATQFVSVGDAVNNFNGDSYPEAKGLASWYSDLPSNNSTFTLMKHIHQNNAYPFKRVIAAVNQTNLTRIQNVIKDHTLTKWDGRLIVSTSPFNTMSSSDANSYFYFDLVPDYLIALKCADNLRSVGITSLTPITSIICNSWMDSYMSENNYKNILSTPVNSYCSLIEANCDTNLNTFCSMGPNGKYSLRDSRGIPSGNASKTSTQSELLAMYPNSKNTICNCFMPDDFYRPSEYSAIITKYGREKGELVYQEILKNHGFDTPPCYNNKCKKSDVKPYTYKYTPDCTINAGVGICVPGLVYDSTSNTYGDRNTIIWDTCPNLPSATTNQAPPTNPVITTKAPVITTKAPVITTKAPVITTKAPVITTKAPVITTKPKVTTKPVNTTPPPTVKKSNKQKIIIIVSIISLIFITVMIALLML